MHPALHATLAAADPEIAELIAGEERRQRDKIRLIASENYVSGAVLAAAGSVLTNKYSEGYPGKRYYEGQQFIDQIEQLCIDRAKALFGAEHANVQPYSGSPANSSLGRSLRASSRTSSKSMRWLSLRTPYCTARNHVPVADTFQPWVR